MKIDVLNKLENNIKKVSGQHTYKISDILNDDFIQTNTKFNSYEDMINQSRLELTETTAEELYSNEGLNNFIQSNTKFKNFKDMCTLAAKEYLTKIVMDL